MDTKLILHILIIAMWCAIFKVDCRTVTVNTNVGKIAGYTKSLFADGLPKTISKFTGIPFAETTAGDNRFKKPQAKASFSDTFYATKTPVACFQSSKERDQEISNYFNLSEDCLVLNVYVPHDFTSVNDSLPVMVWIYGGAFLSGASGLYAADILTAYTDVIVVTVNYRLGMFGFLQSADGSLIGNQGLRDQHLAIKWVHDNIAAFTGNPGLVTIFGESAGGASVMFQAMYAGNRGYFQRVIAESGTSLAYWATLDKPNAEEFITRKGCSSSADPIACLKALTPSQLQLSQTPLDELYFHPGIDGDFVVESPKDIVFGKNQISAAARDFYFSLDIIIGVNNFDGALYMTTIWPYVLGYTDINNPRITRDQFENTVIYEVVDTRLNPKDNYTRDILERVLTFEYTNWTDPDAFTSTQMSTTAVSCDIAFFSPAIRSAQGHAMGSQGKTYFYEFGVVTHIHALTTPNWIIGSNHADDVQFVFGAPLQNFSKPTYTEDEKMVSRAVTTMWSNFAKSGNPNMPTDVTKYTHSNWPEYLMTSQNYFEISNQMSVFSVKKGFYAQRMALWSELIPNIQKISDKN